VNLSKVDEYLEKLDHTHIVLFHEGGKEKRETEYGFIEKGLEKNQHCFYTTQNPQQVLDEMKEFGIDVDTKSNLIHMVKIPDEFENYSKMILDEVATLPSESEIRVISTHNFDFDDEEKTDRMAEIEQCVDDDFANINGNFVCSFQVNQVNEKLRSRFLNQLLDSHKAIIFLRNEKGSDMFMLP
jgi:hypothetical protein|tara:strand:- start:928 stop:1479 length:552 start_codon:yes stop_codon:yes gene_type:complete